MWKPQGVYADFMLYQPTIFFGENALFGLSTFPGARVAVICSNSLSVNIREALLKVFKKKAVFFVDRSWNGEPDIESMKGSISELEKIQPDVIIAIGGGSVIDGTKLCRLFFEFPYFKPGETKIAQLSFKTKFIAVPTTVGSGAEASSAAVYINKDKGCKEMIVSHELQPSVVVLNPEYVKDAPERVIVLSALDAMAHIIEGYISIKKNELTDMEAEKALAVLVNELPKEKKDYQRIQYAGYIGGIVQNHCLVGAAHGLAHQLSEYGYSHGEAVALLLSSVIQVNRLDTTTERRLNQLCKNAGIKSIDTLVEFIQKEIQNMNLTNRKADLYQLLNKRMEDDSFMSNVLNDMGGRGNPVPITKEYIGKILGDIGNGL